MTNTQFRFQVKEKNFLFDFKKNELDNIGTLPINGNNVDVSPNNSLIAFTYENTLIVNEIPVGVPEKEDEVFGQSVSTDLNSAFRKEPFGQTMEIYWPTTKRTKLWLRIIL